MKPALFRVGDSDLTKLVLIKIDDILNFLIEIVNIIKFKSFLRKKFKKYIFLTPE